MDSLTPEERRARQVEDSIESQLSGATYVCRQATERILKSPSTAEFHDERAYRKDLGKGNSHIQFQVDAQNSFGAMLRSTVDCKVQLRNGQYSLLSIRSWNR